MEQIIALNQKFFSQAVCEKIGYYVYVLINPITNTIFYVGKGVANRVFEHEIHAMSTTDKGDKLDIIREIHRNGQTVVHKILRHGLTQEQAFEIESACIDLLGLDNLTNVVSGHYSYERGLMSVDEVEQLYAATPVILTEPTVIINTWHCT